MALWLTTSCTGDFDQINTDPTKASEAVWDPNYFLPQAQNRYINVGYDAMLYQSTAMQVLASTVGYYGNGDKYVNTSGSTGYQGAIFNRTYETGADLAEMIRLTAGKDQYVNLYNIGRIMQALNFQRGTDVYGDIPYSQAFSAKTGITTPKYDTQQSIYMSLLTELEQATAALDASKAKPTGDLFYGGDITKWKKFGYSVMLRIAMRMTKVDPTTAKTWAEKAAAGGVFTSIDDNAKEIADANNATSAIYNVYQVSDDFRELRWSKTFIDMLKTTSDPRLSAIAEVPQAGAANNASQTLVGNNAASVQVGLPNGFDLNGGATDIRQQAGYPGATGSGTDIAPLGNYSRPRISVYLKRAGTLMVLTYPETELLLAEAKVRGWNVSGTAADHYKNALIGAMTSLSQLDATATIATETATAFATAHPLDVSSTDASLKAINTEYWKTTGSMFNFIETWNNWRRSGYPTLTPVNYPGNVTNATIPRRMIYLSTENVTNAANYASAVTTLTGGDLLTSRVWWDK
ncbi:SusD/RagB family nutrient-binding outer membrane lipoprotein [Spirosoma agri]|uniref:SusD/RagB family nutrient-binding outer membrane lipoprotein n=2 Tax=Spirosoma agri TaxID=1987381 RepID=A0A6M0IGS3_9BACT|nr:SusD/RagB family nutrient-binding outer membrane lipoprotein [Spirosoma agri]